jgi:hypothetical protein
MPPFRVTEPTPGGWPSGTPSTRAGCFPTSAFVPAALSRGFLHIRRRTVDIPRFSARPSSPRPRGRVLPRHFRRVRSVTSRISGIVGIVTNVPVHDSPSVCPCPHAINRRFGRVSWGLASRPAMNHARGAISSWKGIACTGMLPSNHVQTPSAWDDHLRPVRKGREFR